MIPKLAAVFATLKSTITRLMRSSRTSQWLVQIKAFKPKWWLEAKLQNKKCKAHCLWTLINHRMARSRKQRRDMHLAILLRYRLALIVNGKVAGSHRKNWGLWATNSLTACRRSLLPHINSSCWIWLTPSQDKDSLSTPRHFTMWSNWIIWHLEIQESTIAPRSASYLTTI
jgi:hypothetical protein